MKSFALKVLLPSLLLAGCTTVPSGPWPESWKSERLPAQQGELFAKPIAEAVPFPEAFKGWRDNKSYVSSPVAYADLKKIEFRCDKPVLYPTHPQQTMKLYHVFRFGTYDHFKLKADDEVCKVGSPRPNSAGKRLCFRADDVEYAVVSDVYEDECGNLYRGFKEVMFLKKNETMGSLFSAGRAAFPKPRAEYALDMMDGHTYAVPLKEFLFVTDLFPGEEAKAKAFRAEALAKTHRFDQATHTFLPR